MITINRLEDSDLPSLSSLYEELSDKKTDLNKLKKSFEWINSNSDYLLIGAKDDKILVGSLMSIVCHDVVGECRPFMVLENVIVKSSCRGKGIGKKLISYIENYAKNKNCYYIFFISSSERKRAHQFYESLGYDIDIVKGFKKFL